MRPLKRLLFVGVLLPLISWLIFVYPWQRLVDYLPGYNPLSVPVIIMLWVLPVLFFYIWARTRSPLSAPLGRFSVNWLGICLMFFNAAMLTEIYALAFSPSPQQLAALLASGGIVLSLYGVYCASSITTNFLTIESSKLNQPYKAIQLSDLHIGSRSLNFVLKAITMTNRLQPDVVFITGDVIDMSQVKPESLKILNRIQAPTYMVTGNHDRYVGSEKHFSAIEQAGVKLLDNVTDLHIDLQVLGIADDNHHNQVRDNLATMTIDESKYSILLYHKPENFSDVKKSNIDLMLSGHTHGGQIFPFNFMVKRQFPYIKGLYQEDNSSLYVSQGTGTWGPVMRLGSRNEITVFELRPKQL